MEICIIRHTTPAIEKGVCYGQTDVPLADSFQLEAQAVLKKSPVGIEKVYSSPLQRCVKLGTYIAEQLCIPLAMDERLKELNFGLWEGQKWDAIEPTAIATWMDDYVYVQCPGGESYSDLAIRAGEFLRALKHQGLGSVAVVTHHGVMKAFHALIREVSLQEGMATSYAYGEAAIYRI